MNQMSQRGAALFTAVVLLIVITLLCLAAIRSSTLELRMAGNSETQMSALENAQSIVDAAIVNPENLPITTTIGSTVCIGTQPAGTGCTKTNPSSALGAGLFSAQIAANQASVLITQLSAGGSTAPPRGSGSGLNAVGVARFSVRATYNRRDERRGNVEITEGILYYVPSSPIVVSTGS